MIVSERPLPAHCAHLTAPRPVCTNFLQHASHLSLSITFRQRSENGADDWTSWTRNRPAVGEAGESASDPDPGVSPPLSPASDGLLCLWRARHHHHRRELLDQVVADVDAIRTRGLERLAHTPVDHQDGVRRVGRCRSDLWLAASVLRRDRRRARCPGTSDARWNGRRLDHLLLRPTTSIALARFSASWVSFSKTSPPMR